MGGHAALVESEEDSLGFDPLDREANDLRQSAGWVWIAKMGNPWDRRDRGYEALGLEPGLLLLVGDPGIGECGGRGAKADAGEDVFEPGAPSPFLITTGEERLETQTAPDVEDAGPDGTAETVAAERHEVGAECGEIDRDMADGL